MLKIQKFGASWCGPCKMLNPVLDELKVELDGVVEFESVDVDVEPEKAAEAGVMSVPTVFFVKDDEVVDKFVGYFPKDAIAARIKAQI
jgi:thioredoxin 1